MLLGEQPTCVGRRDASRDRPATGLPTRAVIATWVTAPTALDADGLATALFFTEPARLAGSFDFEFARMRADGRVEFSPGLPGEVFVA